MDMAAEPGERPRSISVIGWTTAVFSVLLASKSLIDLAVWKVMGPAVPTLLGAARDPSVNVPYVRTLLAHLTEIKLAQAVAWIGVAFIGVGLLRLRPWARVALQLVGAFILLYFACILALWARVDFARDQSLGSASFGERAAHGSRRLEWRSAWSSPASSFP